MAHGRSKTEFASGYWGPIRQARYRLAQTGGRVARYVRRISRLVSEAVRALNYRVAVILGLSLLAISARGGALGSLILFVRQVLSENRTMPRWLQLLGFGPETPVWSGAVCLTLFVITSVATFACARLAAGYAVDCVERLVRGRYARALRDIREIEPNMIVRVLGVGSMQFARMVRAMLGFPLSFLTFLLGLGFLFLINVPLTLGVMLVIPAILLPLLLLSRNTILDNREMRHLGKEVVDAQKAAVKTIQEDPSEESIDAALRSYVEEPNVDRRNRILVRNWTLRQRVGLVSEMFTNFLLVGLAFGLPIILSTGQELLADLLGFVVSLRFTLYAVQDMSRQFAVVNRFLEPAECLINPALAVIHFPSSGEDDLDDDAINEM